MVGQLLKKIKVKIIKKKCAVKQDKKETFSGTLVIWIMLKQYCLIFFSKFESNILCYKFSNLTI